MPKHLSLLPLALLLACGGAPPEPAPAPPPPLAYEVPPMPGATYVQADTAAVQVDAGGQMVDVTVASLSTLAMEFEPGDDGGVRVTAIFEELDARATNPMEPSQTADESHISGPLIFTLSPTGEGTLVRSPEIEDAASGFVSPGLVAATFFPRLPGQAVRAGDQWTDTITVRTDDEGSSIDATSIITYTVAGDTLVEDRTLLLVRMSGLDERLVEASAQGMEMVQEASGTSEGWFLWNPDRRLPEELVYTTVSTGTMEVAAAPFPLGLRAESTTRIVLQEDVPPEG